MFFSEIFENFRFWIEEKISSSDFQSKMSVFPFFRSIANKDAEKIYDIVAGFVYSQILFLLVRLDILGQLRGSCKSSFELSKANKINEKNIKILCNAAVSLGLLRINFRNEYSLGRLGAEVLGVPGLQDMILHHEMFYRDLSNPVDLIRSKYKTELSEYWPYVLSGKKENTLVTAQIYSELMASSQMLVSQETLRLVDFDKYGSIMDVGGGNGTFLAMLAKRFKNPHLILFDLPQVVKTPTDLIEGEIASRIEIIEGNFFKSELPMTADAIILNRVLYDHNDNKVELILQKTFNALLVGGSLIISEPMSGGKRPIKSGDAYFGMYTMAMTSGQPRSIEAHTTMLKKVGFRKVREIRGARNFITKVIVAQK